MGDESEWVYEQTLPVGPSIRFGFRRPKGIDFRKIPNTMRHAPDYYAVSGYFVEVMGMGRDGILKSMKEEKYDALKVWKRIGTMLKFNDLMLFVWNSHKKQYLLLPWSKVTHLIQRSRRTHGIQSFESDGNTYFRLDWEDLANNSAWVEAFYGTVPDELKSS
jgi:hypothetical protein